MSLASFSTLSTTDPVLSEFQRRLIAFLAKIEEVAGAKRLPGYAIGTSVTRIAHGLPGRPNVVLIGPPNSNAVVWMPQTQDEKYVFLQASSATTVDVFVK